MQSLTLAAPAKINLTLDILGRRPDGYHELRMAMQSVSLCDTVTVETGVGGGIAVETPGRADLPVGPENLAWKAAAAFAQAVGDDCGGVRITVNKRIPVCAGLAGGSADAAAVLRALHALRAPETEREALEHIGERVGSDVPFCVRGGAALAEGRGERLQTWQGLPPCGIVLCKPAFGLSTPELFRRTDGISFAVRPDTEGLRRALANGDLRAAAGKLCNVFEAALSPEEGAEVARLRRALMSLGALGTAMSGSGPTVFGLFEHDVAAVAAAEILKKSCPETFFATPL